MENGAIMIDSISFHALLLCQKESESIHTRLRDLMRGMVTRALISVPRVRWMLPSGNPDSTVSSLELAQNDVLDRS